MYEETTTLTKVLASLSRSLGVAKEVIPIYQDTKPILKNAQNIYQIIKGRAKEAPKTKDDEIQKEKTDHNSPKFFI